MNTRILSSLIGASMLFASNAAIAGPDEDFRDQARAQASKFRAQGWPKSRCTTNATFIDGIIVADKGDLRQGDKFLSVNGISVENLESTKIVEVFDKIAPNSTVAIGVRRNGQDIQVQMPCADIVDYQRTYLAALDLAGKKNWAGCINALASNPSDIFFLELKIGCAQFARRRDTSEVQFWLEQYHTALVEQSGSVPSERPKVAEGLLKARIDLFPAVYRNLVAKVMEWDGGAIWKSVQPDDAKLRTAALEGLKHQLIDPQSAMVEMPYDFIYGTWRPFMSSSFEGFITCGTVNSKNRMGGYVGATPFVAVVDQSGFTRYIGMDDPANQYIKTVEFGCAAMLGKFTYVGDTTSKQSSSGANMAAAPSMSDELGKLAELHKSGALTDQEYAAAKARILGGT